MLKGCEQGALQRRRICKRHCSPIGSFFKRIGLDCGRYMIAAAGAPHGVHGLSAMSMSFLIKSRTLLHATSCDACATAVRSPKHAPRCGFFVRVDIAYREDFQRFRDDYCRRPDPTGGQLFRHIGQGRPGAITEGTACTLQCALHRGASVAWLAFLRPSWGAWACMDL